jgi:hypothetical protein
MGRVPDRVGIFLLPLCPGDPWGLGFLSQRVKQPGHEGVCSRSSKAEVNSAWSHTSIPMSSQHGA